MKTYKIFMIDEKGEDATLLVKGDKLIIDDGFNKTVIKRGEDIAAIIPEGFIIVMVD